MPGAPQRADARGRPAAVTMRATTARACAACCSRPRAGPTCSRKLPRSEPDGVVARPRGRGPGRRQGRGARPHARAHRRRARRRDTRTSRCTCASTRSRPSGSPPTSPTALHPSSPASSSRSSRRPTRSTRSRDALDATPGSSTCTCSPGIETALRRRRASRELLRPPVAVAYFGAEDFVADMGGVRTEASTEVLYARSRVALAARLAGVLALDQVVTRLDDDDALPRRRGAQGRALGYRGKLCIHPAQVPLAHRAFSSVARGARPGPPPPRRVRRGGRPGARPRSRSRARWSTSPSPATHAPCSRRREYAEHSALRRLAAHAQPRAELVADSRHGCGRSSSSSPRRGGSRTPQSSPEADERRIARRARPAASCSPTPRRFAAIRAARADADRGRRRPARCAASSTCSTTRFVPHQVPADLRRAIVELETARRVDLQQLPRQDRRSPRRRQRDRRDPAHQRRRRRAPRRVGSVEADRARGRRAHPRARAAAQPGRTRRSATATTSRSRSPPASSTRTGCSPRSTTSTAPPRAPFAEWKHELDQSLAGALRLSPSTSSGRGTSTTRSSRSPPAAGAIALDHLFADADLEALTLRTYDGLGLDVRPVLDAQRPLRARRQEPARVLHRHRPRRRRTRAVQRRAERAVDGHDAPRVRPRDLRPRVRPRAPVARPRRRARAHHRGHRDALGPPPPRPRVARARSPASTTDDGRRARAARSPTRAAPALLVFARWVLVMTNFERASTPIPTPTSTRSGGTSSSATSSCAGPTAATRPTGRRRSTSPPRPSTTRTTSTASCSRRSSTRRSPTRTGGLVDRRDAGALLVRDVFAPGASLRWDELVDPRDRRAAERARHLARELASEMAAELDLGLRRAGGGRRRRHRAASGAATAELLAREGCRVAVLARTPKPTCARRRRSCSPPAPTTRSGSSATCSTPARSRPRSRSSTSAGASATRS